MKVSEVIRLLEQDGWFEVRQKGSHRQYKHPVKTGVVTVAVDRLSDDLAAGTLNSILKRAILKNLGMRKFLIIIEKTATGYSAYVPDLPGCVATGATKADTETNIYEAITFHLAGVKGGRPRNSGVYIGSSSVINCWVKSNQLK